jgi:hypothetical protein
VKTALIILTILTIANTLCLGYLYHVVNVIMSCIELKQTQLIKELAKTVWKD